MPPRSVKTAAWILATATVAYKILIPGGVFASNALHGASRGDSPVLSAMAAGFALFLIIPRLLLTALACLKILEGRNWARVVFVLLTCIEIYAAFWSFRLAMLLGVRALPGWFLLEGGAAFLYAMATISLFSETANAWFRGGLAEA
jgi:hypothetical protein